MKQSPRRRPAPHRRFLLPGLAAAVLAAAALAAAPAGAGVGVGIDTGAIEVQEPLHPGGRYPLATVTVSNRGDQLAEFSLNVKYQEGRSEARPPAEWFAFAPPAFALAPGESRPVQVSLRLPPDAPPGAYFALVAAQPRLPGPGAMIGVGVGAKVSFRVAPGGLAGTAAYYMRHWWRAAAPWSYVVLGLAVLTLLRLVPLRRYRFRLVVEKGGGEPPAAGGGEGDA